MKHKYSKDLNISLLHQNQPDLDFGTIVTVGAQKVHAKTSSFIHWSCQITPTAVTADTWE